MMRERIEARETTQHLFAIDFKWGNVIKQACRVICIFILSKTAH
jgi:hypothetical protein